MEEVLFTQRGKRIRKLGFGCMRLPQKEDNSINMEELCKMIDEYISSGFCYFDTAHGYHKQQSEKALGEVLAKRYKREDYLIATKLPAWKYYIRSKEDAYSIFYNSLDRLSVDYVDYYLFQNMGEERTKCFDKYDLWSFVERLKQEGLIKHFGVSVHDHAGHIQELLENHPCIEFVQLQINYADWFSSQIQAKQCYEKVREFNKEIVVMEPLKGGMLVNLPVEVREVMGTDFDVKETVKLGFSFVNRLEGVPLILSGMSSLEQVRDNIEIFNKIEQFSDTDISAALKAGQKFAEMDRIRCTACNYCIDECAMKVKISKILNALNFAKIYKDRHMAEHQYFSNVFLEGKASSCIGCGRCEEVCPQHLSIRDYMKEALQYFGE